MQPASSRIVERKSAATATAAKEPAPAPTLDSGPSADVRNVTVECPMKPVAGYRGSGIVNLSGRHTEILAGLRTGLVAGGHLFRGRRVLSNEDAVVWILEKLAADGSTGVRS